VRILYSFIVLLSIFTAKFTYAACEFVDKQNLAEAMNIQHDLRSMVSIEIASCSNVSLENGYVGFILNEKNEVIHSGIRSEVSIDYPFIEGDTVEYQWSIMIPKEYSPGNEAVRGEWWIIGQWHDQPDPNLGETWRTYSASSPPAAIYIETRNGVVGIGLSTFQRDGAQKKYKKINWVPVPKGKWLDLNVTINWSRTKKGLISFKIDDMPMFDVISLGPNMLNKYQHYLKLGQYRSPKHSKKSVIYIKDVHIETQGAVLKTG